MRLSNLPFKTGHLFLALAAVMFFITVSLFSSKKPDAPKQIQAEIPTAQIVVPITSISAGKTITLSDVKSVKWPKEYLPQNSTFEEPYDLQGRVAKQDLFPGQPIFKAMVSGTDTNGGLPAVIPAGYRAVSIAVTEVKGVAGFVKPGDRVDVISTFEVDGDTENSKTHTTKTVLQDALVLASAQTMVTGDKYNMETPAGVKRGDAKPGTTLVSESSSEKSNSAPPDKSGSGGLMGSPLGGGNAKDDAASAKVVSSVTLALTPEQSEKLALAEEVGEIRLVLRPETDHKLTQTPGVNLSELVGDAVPAPRHAQKFPVMPPAPPPMPFPSGMSHPGLQVEFIQGTSKSTVDL